MSPQLDDIFVLDFSIHSNRLQDKNVLHHPLAPAKKEEERMKEKEKVSLCLFVEIPK